MNSTILAIDLGKFNSVLCWFDPDARAERFRTTPTTPDDLRRELVRQPIAQVVFEAHRALTPSGRCQSYWKESMHAVVGLP